MKPTFPIDTPEKVTLAREFLGLDKAGLARALRLASINGRNTVHRLEQPGQPIPGPTQLALEYLIEKASKRRKRQAS